ncbi:MAG: L-rhamnose mutarotase [Bacteroidales bacterium]|nr:L-rhamnose mutarotase [Bacteroidales bacterium]
MMYEYIEIKRHSSFKRYCKTLELRNDKDLIDTYKEAHAKDKIWPEISGGMKEVGIIDMEIYISGTRLFMIMDTVPDFDHDKAMKALSLKPRQSEWERYMSKFQTTSPDASAGRKWQVVERIYKMEE